MQTVLDTLKDTVGVTVNVTGKTGAIYDVPVAWAALGVLAHLYVKWGDKRRFVPGLTFWQYVSHPHKTRMHVITFAMIGVWATGLEVAGYGFRDVIPYHWVTGLLYGYCTDSLLKLAVKQVPALGAVVGATRDSRGEMQMPTVGPMPAVPMPPELQPPSPPES